MATEQIPSSSPVPSQINPVQAWLQRSGVSGKILAIDSAKRKITYEDPDSKKKTVKVKKDLDISGLAVGESVDAVLTESVIIKVTK